jgi:hypothetical protein
MTLKIDLNRQDAKDARGERRFGIFPSHSFLGPGVFGVLAVQILSLVASCGPAKPANAPDHPASTWSAPESAKGFGAPAVDGARAMLAAAQGHAFDPGWACADPATDIRGTTAETKSTVAPLGAMASIVLAAVKLTLVAPARSDVNVADVPDYPGAGPVRVFMQAYATVSPEGHVSWADVSGYLAALEEPNKERAPISSLATPLRTELERLVGAASAPECGVPIMTAQELDALPYPLQKDERDVILAKLAQVTRGLPRTCKTAASAGGAWEAHFSHLETVVQGGASLATLRSKLSIQNGALCLGRVEVVKVVTLK